MNNAYKNTTNYDFRSYSAQFKSLVGLFFLILGFGGAATCLMVTGKCSRCTLTDGICYFCVLLGGIQSSLLLDPIGHRACMVLSNVQCYLGQVAVWFGEDLDLPFASTMLLGLGVGSAIGPCIAYVGEVSEPRYRNALVASVHVYKNWWRVTFFAAKCHRTAYLCLALASMVYPCISILCIVCMTPVSPLWLIAKGKTIKAVNVLWKFRRGSMLELFHEIKDMHKFTGTVSLDRETGAVVPANATGVPTIFCPTFVEELDDGQSWIEKLHLKPLKPYILMYFHFMLMNVSLNILRGSPSSHACDYRFWNWTVLLATVLVDFLISMLCIVVDKSYLILGSSLMCTICFVFYGLRSYFSSNILVHDLIVSLFDVAVPLLATVLDACGWMLLTEIFTAKKRNVACCVYPAINIFINLYGNRNFLRDFIPVKLVSESLGVYGTIICIFMSIYFYDNLPKTHNKTLQKISEQFQEKQHRKHDLTLKNIFTISDRKI